jgi:hypothetical protein
LRFKESNRSNKSKRSINQIGHQKIKRIRSL